MKKKKIVIDENELKEEEKNTLPKDKKMRVTEDEIKEEEKNPTPLQEPERKDYTSLLTKLLLSAAVVFILIPSMIIGLAYALFYDATHTEIHTREDYTNQDVFNDVVVYSLNDTVTTEKVRVRITEDALNQVFHNTIYDSGSHFYDMNNFFIDITDEHYIFVLEANLDNWFRTRVKLYTKLIVEEDGVVFKITNLRIGRVDHFDRIPKLFFKVFKIPDINQMFHDHGLHMNFDLQSLSINYKFADLAQDLGDSMGPSGAEYVALVQEVIANPKFFEIIPNIDNAAEGDILLYNMRPTEELYQIPSYTMPDGYLNTIMSNAINKVKGYLENETIVESQYAQPILNYYVRGYDHLSAADKSKVDAYLLAGLIDPATNYYTYTIPDNEQLDYLVKQQAESYPIGSHNLTVELNTNQIDRALSQSEIIGNSIFLYTKDEAEVYTCNYITFNRVNCVADSTSQSLFLTLSVDFNGYSTGISAKASLVDQEFGKAKLHLDGFYIGDNATSDVATEKLLNMVSSALSEAEIGDTLSIVTEGEDTYFVYNIKNMLNTLGYSESAGYTTSFEINGQTSSTPGSFTFNIHD